MILKYNCCNCLWYFSCTALFVVIVDVPVAAVAAATAILVIVVAVLVANFKVNSIFSFNIRLYERKQRFIGLSGMFCNIESRPTGRLRS